MKFSQNVYHTVREQSLFCLFFLILHLFLQGTSSLIYHILIYSFALIVVSDK